MEIKGIEPFNECWLKNCINHHVASVIKYYGLDPRIILSNEKLVFIKDKDFNRYVPRFKSQKSNAAFLLSLGIKLSRKRPRAECALSIIKSSLDNQLPVMCSVDYFYLPTQSNLDKQHRKHFILIYGYDDEKKELDIIEHKNDQTLVFHKLKISYDIFLKCYKKSLEINKNNFSISIFEKVQNIRNEKFSFIKPSLHGFNKAISEFKAYLKINNKEPKLTEFYINFMFNSAIKKAMLKYFLQYFIKIDEKLFFKVVDNYRFIGCVLKKMLLSNNDKKALGEVDKRLNEIVYLEREILILLNRNKL